MSAIFDSTTKAAYDAATTAQLRAEAIVASLTGTISVKVFNGSNTEMGSGTMAAPWAPATAGAVVLGEVASFTVGTTATPDADWYIRFQNADVSRWARGSFGLSSSGQDFTWSMPAWTATDTGTIGTATIVCAGNAAPVFTAAPTSASIAGTGGTIQFTAVDPEGGSVFYSLTTTRAGITINASGLVTVTAAAAGTSGNIVVEASDGILTASATCAVTVASPSTDLIRFAPGHYIRPGLGDSLASVQTKIASYDSRVRGVILLRYWTLIETSKGVYDWSFFDAVADACDAAGKTFVFRVQDRVFGSTTPSGAVPAYLVSENLTYYRLLSTPASGAALWRAAAMSYNIDLYCRILERYRARANFIGIAGEESIYGQIEALHPDYSASAYVAQEIRRMQALRAYAPEIPYWLYTNWITGDDGSRTAMQAWFAAARADKGVYVNGGPDMVRARPPAGTSDSDGENVLRGEVGGIDHRGVYLMLGSTENEEWSRGSTVAQIYAEAVTDRRCNIMSWSTNPAQWLTDVYPYIATNRTVSAIPSAMVGLVDVL